MYSISSVQYAKPLGHILISDLVVTSLFMHSLPGMILLYLATPFTPKVFCIRYAYTKKGIQVVDT